MFFFPVTGKIAEKSSVVECIFVDIADSIKTRSSSVTLLAILPAEICVGHQKFFCVKLNDFHIKENLFCF